MLEKLLIGVLFFWGLYNIIVLFSYTPAQMYEDLWLDQGKIGRVFGNIFYAPAWILKFLWCIICKIAPIILKYILYIYYMVARFFQIIYHSIFDLV